MVYDPIQPPQTYQDQFFLCKRGVRSPLWLWMLDTNASPTDVPGWVLHQNVTCGAEHQPGRAHYQQASVRGTTKCIREDSSQEDETSWTLPPTPRTPSQKACTVGTNTRASIKRTSHTYLRGHTKERCCCRKYKRAGQMYGEPRWPLRQEVNLHENVFHK